jgi:hypothetical protein
VKEPCQVVVAEVAVVLVSVKDMDRQDRILEGPAWLECPQIKMEMISREEKTAMLFLR